MKVVIRKITVADTITGKWMSIDMKDIDAVEDELILCLDNQFDILSKELLGGKGK